VAQLKTSIMPLKNRGDCAELMEKQGFSHIVNLEKGIEGWKKSGFEVVK
jgi:rhodanese-related sulfurtransferase